MSGHLTTRRDSLTTSAQRSFCFLTSKAFTCVLTTNTSVLLVACQETKKLNACKPQLKHKVQHLSQCDSYSPWLRQKPMGTHSRQVLQSAPCLKRERTANLRLVSSCNMFQRCSACHGYSAISLAALHFKESLPNTGSATTGTARESCRFVISR